MSIDLWYELRNSVYSREFEVATALLKANPGLTSVRNGLGETVLHFLAVENDLEGVAWLYARGFDLNSKNDFGTPVVFEVAQLGCKELLLWFIEHGVDIAALDQEKQNILAYLHEFEEDDMIEFLSINAPNIALQLTPASGRG